MTVRSVLFEGIAIAMGIELLMFIITDLIMRVAI